MRIRKLLVGEGLVGLAADVDKYDEIYRLGYVPRYSYGQVAMQCHDAMFLADTTPNCFTAEILLLRRCHHVVCIGIFFVEHASIPQLWSARNTWLSLLTKALYHANRTVFLRSV